MVPDKHSPEYQAQIEKIKALRINVPKEIRLISAQRTPAIRRNNLARLTNLEKSRSEMSAKTTGAAKPCESLLGKEDGDRELVEGEGSTVQACGRNAEISIATKPIIRGQHTRAPVLRFRKAELQMPQTEEVKPSTLSTLSTLWQDHTRLPQVQIRRDIYDLAEEEEVIPVCEDTLAAPIPMQQAPNAFHGEPPTSSFKWPETAASPTSQESRTIEQYIRDAQNPTQTRANKTSQNTSLHPSIIVVPPTKDTEETSVKIPECADSPREELLDELEFEPLRLDGDEQAPSPQQSPPSPERLRGQVPAGLRSIRSLQYHADDTAGENYEDFEEPVPKKQRRSSRQKPKDVARNAALRELNVRRESKAAQTSSKKGSNTVKTYGGKLWTKQKKKRSLPVNELVMVSQRPYETDVEYASSSARELSEDAISLPPNAEASDDNQFYHRKPPGMRIKFHPSKWRTTIDVTKFRIPKRTRPSSRSRRCQQRSPSYSDGFQGNEAEPTGRYMRVKCISKNRGNSKKTTVFVTQLTIVSERLSDAILEVRPRLPAQKQHQSTNKHSKRSPHDDGQPRVNEEDPMLMDGQEEEQLVDRNAIQVRREFDTPVLLRPISTPRVFTKDNSPYETSSKFSSPLKRKRQPICVKSQGTGSQPVLKAAEKNTVSKSHQQEPGLLGIPEEESAKRHTSVPHEDWDPRVSQELMMVSVKKKPADTESDHREDVEESDSQRGSASESCAESNSEGESDFGEDGEDGEDDAPEEYCDEEDIENEEQYAEQEETTSENSKRELIGTFSETRGNNDQQPNAVESSKQENEEEEESQIPVNRNFPATADVGQFLPNYGSDHTTSQYKVNGFGSKLHQMASPVLEITPSSPAVDSGSSYHPVSQPHLDPAAGIQMTANEAKNTADGSTLMAHDSHPLSETSDDSWRPRAPVSSGVLMEVDEDIVDSASPLPKGVRKLNRLQMPSRRHSSVVRSQCLTIVRSQPLGPVCEEVSANLHGNQDSVILEETQRMIRCSQLDVVPETSNFDAGEPDPEIAETYFLPQASYFERASQQLQEPLRRSQMARTKSLPAHMFNAQLQINPLLMASSITMSQAFNHTMSPTKSGSRRPNLIEEMSSPAKSLRSLTRQASFQLGTRPGSARRRTTTTPWVTPFKKDLQ